MEQEKTKRAREGEGDDNNNAKKRDLYGINLLKDKKDMEEEECSSKAWDSQLASGVFDFPWLKDGVTSKSEDHLLDFEENFSEAYGLCETAEASMPHILEDKLVENAWEPLESDTLELEAEDVDCIWSSLLNNPL